MKHDVQELDRHIKFMGEQASRLEDLAARPGNSWATKNAAQMRAIAATLLLVRRDQQMTGMSGQRLDARPDQAAINAVPALQDKKALVCYFQTDADRDEFASTLQQLMPTARTVRVP